MATTTNLQFAKRYHAALRKLAMVRRQMREEVALRKAAETKLAAAAQLHSRLLAQSQLIQQRSRRLAHQVLLAQEQERREISRELHDEVAQILAGINVRLAAL